MSTEKWYNQDQYRKTIESARGPGKGRIRARTEKHSERVLKNSGIRFSTRKTIESGGVLGKGRIPTTTEKLSERVPKNCRIRISTGKLYNPGEYQEKVHSVRVPEKGPIGVSTEKW